MKALKRFLRRFRENFQLQKYSEDLNEVCHFVSGPEFLAEAVLAQNGLAVVLASDLLPGFDLLGRFESKSSHFGNISLHLPDGRIIRSDLRLSGCQISLFPKFKTSPEAIWSEELEPIALCQRILLVCLQKTKLDKAVSQFALRWISKTDRAHFERAAIFSLLNSSLKGVRLTISELRATKEIYLVDPAEKLESTEKGSVWLEDGALVRNLLKICRINFQAKAESPKSLEKDLEEPKSDFPYIEPAWGSGECSDEMVTIPIYGQASLVVDTKRLKLRTPVLGAAGAVQFDLSEPLYITFEHSEQRGDTKVHEIHLLTISDEKHSVVLRARFKDYYEGGSVQAELDEYQDRAKTVLFSLVRVLREPSKMPKFRELY